jgi:hypothetical protein
VDHPPALTVPQRYLALMRGHQGLSGRSRRRWR